MNGYRNLAGWLLLGLLSGYLIFNRSFAQLGFPPFYVGEIVLVICLVPAIANWREAFLSPLKRSWIFRFIAAFMILGLLRIAWDARTYGILAARDGVICIYAIVAFLAPFVLGAQSKRIVSTLFPVSMAALIFVAAFQFHWIDTARWPSIKPDFLAVAAAVAFLNSFMMMFSARSLKWLYFVLSCAPGFLIYLLPTRALWIAPPLLAVAALAIMVSIVWTRRLRVPFVVPVVAVAVVAFLTLLLSIYAPQTARERAQSLFFGSSTTYQTREGQLGAASIHWRKMFWRTAIDETLHQSPALGFGFGTNLTDLLRDKPEWPEFEESQRLNPPNRHPHSAHVTVFARLGFAGLALWIMILTSTAGAGMRNFGSMRSASEIKERINETKRWFAIAFFTFGVWLIYLLAMTFGVVLENPFGGTWFWAMTGLIASRAAEPTPNALPCSSNNHDDDPGEEEPEDRLKRSAENTVDM